VREKTIILWTKAEAPSEGTVINTSLLGRLEFFIIIIRGGRRRRTGALATALAFLRSL
jgi:hypothetical protein